MLLHFLSFIYRSAIFNTIKITEPLKLNDKMANQTRGCFIEHI